LLVDLVASRVYAVERATNKLYDRYLTSPGRPGFSTQGNLFVIRRTIIRPSWFPPASPWAAGLKPQPPGLENPMGIFKRHLGQYGEYVHGIPTPERAFLGRPASHGCMRMSNENVLQVYQRYADIGSTVRVNRDVAQSRALAAKFQAAGGADHPITDGAARRLPHADGRRGAVGREPQRGHRLRLRREPPQRGRPRLQVRRRRRRGRDAGTDRLRRGRRHRTGVAAGVQAVRPDRRQPRA